MKVVVARVVCDEREMTKPTTRIDWWLCKNVGLFGVEVGSFAGTWVPMFCRNVDSFPFRQISGTPYVLKLAKVMPDFSGDHVCIWWF